MSDVFRKSRSLPPQQPPLPQPRAARFPCAAAATARGEVRLRRCDLRVEVESGGGQGERCCALRTKRYVFQSYARPFFGIYSSFAFSYYRVLLQTKRGGGGLTALCEERCDARRRLGRARFFCEQRIRCSSLTLGVFSAEDVVGYCRSRFYKDARVAEMRL